MLFVAEEERKKRLKVGNHILMLSGCGFSARTVKTL